MKLVIVTLGATLLAACGSSSDSPSSASGGAGGTVATAGSPTSGGSATAGMPSSGAGGGGSGSGSSGAATGGGAGEGGDEPSAGTSGASVGGTGALEAWPGPADVMALPATGLVDGNVSGLTYQPAEGADPAVLWATANIPGTLYRLLPAKDGFASDSANGWSSGKLLHFTNGQGAADAEGVTFGASPANGLYVASEHDNSAASTSRLSILLYDVTDAGMSLMAQKEWNVTSVLPKVGANLGIEAITFVPDADLTDRGFLDDSTQSAYDPTAYGQHGGGVFFVGVEGTGNLHGLVLGHEDGSFHLVSTLSSPFAGVMSLEYDRDSHYLWVGCDATCDNQVAVYDLGASLTLLRRFERPAQLPNSDNEGIAIAPDSECSGGLKNFFWTDDANLDGFAIRRGKIPCGPFL